MNIHHQNSFVRQRPLNLSIVPFQPVRNNLSRTARQESDTVELSYSHGKPSTSADVMTPVCRVFQLPETAEGAAEEAKHTVMASGQVDDSVTVTVDSNTQSSSSGSVHNFSLEFGNLSGGFHCLFAEHHNINYYPDPTGNISLINGTVGPCPPISIIPDENEKDECECSCEDGEGDPGGPPSDSPARTMAGVPALALNSTSAGGRVSRLATLQYMRWSASFGVFRGMGGIPSGRLEITGYQYSSSLLTPEGLAYRHPAASAVLVPEGGIAPNQSFRVYEGGSFTNYVCDADGQSAFGIGSTSSGKNRAQFVRTLSREDAAVTALREASYLRISKVNGSATFYHLATGLFAGYISPRNSLLTAEDAENYLVLLREENGNLRQIWNLWDGLADIVTTENGYCISLYLPSRITGLDQATGLYTVTGEPFKTFTVSGNTDDKSLTVTERSLDLPSSVPPFTTTWTQVEGAWQIALGDGEDAITTSRVKTELEPQGTYRIVTTVSKGESVASRVAEEYLSHPTGELLLTRTEGYGSPEAQTTSYKYDDAGRMISVTAPDGGATTYLHDRKGRITVITTPWAGGQAQLEQFTYLDDGSAYSNEPSQVDLNMVDASGIPHLHRRDQYSYRVADHIKRVEKRSTANGLTRLEVTETWQGDASNTYARGRSRMTQAANGVQTWYDYTAATAHGALYCITRETRLNGEPVTGQSRKNLQYISPEGNTVREEEYILDSEGTWRQLSSADYEFDEQNRWIKRTRSNGRVTERALMCDGRPLWERNEDGVLTSYSYDTARQLIETIRSATPATPETITSYKRDALGRILEERTDTGAMSATRRMACDLLGRPTLSTDILGRATTYAYSADGLTTTMTTPAGATFITTNYTDGSVAHEAGTGQRELYHIYDYNGGRVRETVKLADQATILSQRLENGFGEIVVATSPTTLNNTYLYERTVYDSRGLITQKGTDGKAPVLYSYDGFGNLVKETLKLAASPTVENSDITEYSHTVEKREDGIYRVTVTSRCNGNGGVYAKSQAELISESASLESKVASANARGDVSISWTEYGEGTERFQKKTVPVSAITAVATVTDGFTVSDTDHSGITTTISRTYTADGITYTQTDGRGNTVTTISDMAGRQVSVTDAAGSTTATAYDAHFDEPCAIVDHLGHTTCYRYDIRGRKAAQWGTGVQPVLFTYDEAGRLTEMTTFRADDQEITTDPAGRTDGDATRWEYHDATGLEVKKTYADGNTIMRTYDAFNQPATRTDGRGIVTTYAWESARGLLLSESYSDETPARRYAWNTVGKLIEAVDSSGAWNISYNQYGEQESSTWTEEGVIHLVSEQRDALGRSSGHTYSKGGILQQTTGIGYGADGRIATASFTHGGAEQTFSYGYLEGSNLLHTLSHPNNILVTRTYEEHRNLPVSMNATRGTTDVVLRRYGYDAAGRPVTGNCARKGTAQADGFSYNGRGELMAANLGTENYGYTYDNIGNRKIAQEIAGEISYEANSLNQYTGITHSTLNSPPSTLEQPFSPAYDANGNQTLVKTRTGIWSVTYNAENRPVSFTSQDGQTMMECAYDYMGRRNMKKVTVNGSVTLHQRYVYRGYLQISCVDVTRSGHPALWHITWDPREKISTRPLAIQKNGTWYTYGYDLAKNVMEVFNTQGTIATAYSYAPYGAVTATGTAQPIQWSSEFYDSEIGMVYYNYRHYNPLDGRWTSRDSLMEKGGINLYGFVEGRMPYTTDYRGNTGFTDIFPPDGPPYFSPPEVDEWLGLPVTIDLALSNDKMGRLLQKAITRGANRITASYGSQKFCELTSEAITKKVEKIMRESNFMDNNLAEIRMKVGDYQDGISHTVQEMAGIFKDSRISSTMSFSISAEMNVPLCSLGGKQVGGKLAETLTWSKGNALLSPQDRFRSRLGFVSQQDFSVRAGLTLMDLKIGRVNITCDLSAGITTTQWRKFEFPVSGSVQVTYSF